MVNYWLSGGHASRLLGPWGRGGSDLERCHWAGCVGFGRWTHDAARRDAPGSELEMMDVEDG